MRACPRSAPLRCSRSSVTLHARATLRFASSSRLLAFSEPVSAERPIKFERTLLPDGFRVSHQLPQGKEYLPPRRALRTEVTAEEAAEIKELRNEDPFGWSQSSLSKRYNVPGEIIGQTQPMPQSKRVAMYQGNVPKRRDVIARRRWTAANRIERGLPPRTELLPEPDIMTYRGRRNVQPNLDQRAQEQRKQNQEALSKRLQLPSASSKPKKKDAGKPAKADGKKKEETAK